VSPDPLERIKQFRRLGKAPGRVIIATETPMSVNQILVVSGFRFAVDQELSQEEFQRRMLANEELRREQEIEMGINPADAARGSFQVHGRGAAVEGAEFASAPAPEQRYFYAMRRV
jgi:hypothetical protein